MFSTPLKENKVLKANGPFRNWGGGASCGDVPLSLQVLPFLGDPGGSPEDLVFWGHPRLLGAPSFTVSGHNTATGGSFTSDQCQHSCSWTLSFSCHFLQLESPRNSQMGPEYMQERMKRSVAPAGLSLSLSLSAGSLQVWILPPAESRRCRSSCSWGCAVEH